MIYSIGVKKSQRFRNNSHLLSLSVFVFMRNLEFLQEGSDKWISLCVYFENNFCRINGNTLIRRFKFIPQILKIWWNGRKMDSMGSFFLNLKYSKSFDLVSYGAFITTEDRQKKQIQKSI